MHRFSEFIQESKIVKLRFIELLLECKMQNECVAFGDD